MFRYTRIFLTAAALFVLAAGALSQLICPVGNLEDPLGLTAPNLFQGDETYAYLIHPEDQCQCDEGFVQLQNARMMLEFDAAHVPFNFTASAGLRQGVYDPTFDAWVPGDWLYETFPMDFEVMTPGIFVVEIPTPNVRWVGLDDYVFITIRFHEGFQVDLPVSGLDEPGICYVSPDEHQWIDLFGVKGPDKASGGKIIIWGDVLCGVSNPTGVQPPRMKLNLGPAKPNPFNPGTTVSFSLTEADQVGLRVYDSRGTLVRTLREGCFEPGTVEVYWNGRDDGGRSVAAGVYFIRAESGGGEVRTTKAAIVK